MNKLQSKLLNEIFDNEEKLGDWERKFADDLYNKDPSYNLTGPQNHKLIEVHHRVVFER